MSSIAGRPLISPEESARRRDAIDWARAANIRQGYVYDPVLEDANERYVRGEITLDQHHEEMLEAVRQGR